MRDALAVFLRQARLRVEAAGDGGATAEGVRRSPDNHLRRSDPLWPERVRAGGQCGVCEGAFRRGFNRLPQN